MACFLVPTTEAIVTTVASKVIKSKENKAEAHISEAEKEVSKVKLSTKFSWLNKMLWGGSALLAFEHFWHGEVIPTFPFLTAVRDGETGGMLAEMSTAGVAMAVFVTVVWIAMVTVVSYLEKNSQSRTEAEERTR